MKLSNGYVEHGITSVNEKKLTVENMQHQPKTSFEFPKKPNWKMNEISAALSSGKFRTLKKLRFLTS